MEKAGVKFEIEKLSIFIGDIKFWKKGKLDKNYNEKMLLSDYMKNENIEITIEINWQQKFYLLYYGFTQKNILKLIQIIEVNILKKNKYNYLNQYD